MRQNRYDLIEPEDSRHAAFYEKMLKKDRNEGYYIGVSTTGIACRFGCSATPPQKKNTIFSKRLFDLICLGFRECKVCKPSSDGSERAGQDEDIRRYEYVKEANERLKIENNSDSMLTETVTYQRYWTPIGVMIACFYKEECCLLEFMDRRELAAELLFLKKKLNANLKKRSTSLGRRLGIELQEYFAGFRYEFSIPAASIGTDFQLQTWKALREIPYGTTRSYKGQAEVLGRPTAVRAVANANGKNRICILIPCHRVIGDNGDLRGYAGGLDRKQFLLELENNRSLQ
ncbi:methylated-DNA--[protein]-cysteine S-methyltransferase [Fictibacillus sp. NRS-1165]|uniref:methylated-DNA--[protein]-cysteine S-methyltransferase n=1 Tax=Fictibacillus sp. NRS-1165 TaxID=3144463 RepID=UPI003D1EF498